MHVDSTPGAVRITAHHRDAAEARVIAQAQADRASLARASDQTLRWVARQHVSGADEPVGNAPPAPDADPTEPPRPAPGSEIAPDPVEPAEPRAIE